jgi:hypothetical protein
MKRISIAALTAIMITAPGMACTDWKAVAAFDALILEGDKIAVKEERSPEAAPLIEADCRQAQKLLDYAISGKDQSLIDQRAKQLANCHGAEARYANDLVALSLDRDHALADTCGGRQ